MTTIKKVVNGEIVGKINFDFSNAKQKELMVHFVHVDDAHRGKGYGKALMQYAIEEAKKANCSAVNVHVGDTPFPLFSDLEARRKFFETLGFKFEDDFGVLDLTPKLHKEENNTRKHGYDSGV